MILDKVEDKRTTLDRARRKELERFATEKGIADIQPGMPAQLMRRILRDRGVTQIMIPVRQLGQTRPTVIPAPGSSKLAVNASRKAPQREDRVEVSADTDLERQWQEKRFAPPPAKKPVLSTEKAKEPFSLPVREKKNKRSDAGKNGLSEFHAMKRRLKSLGISFSNKDKMVDLKEKLADHLMTA